MSKSIQRIVSELDWNMYLLKGNRSAEYIRCVKIVHNFCCLIFIFYSRYKKRQKIEDVRGDMYETKS